MASGTARAKVFWTGRSQAVRLPRAFRFEGSEVTIRREGNAVVLEPIARRAWPAGWLASFALPSFPDVEPLPPSHTRDDVLDDL